MANSESPERVLLAHGEGGAMMRRLIQDRIIHSLGEAAEVAMDDAALLPKSKRPLAMTTDSYVVSPLFFPGGDIGRLAVFGTVNDLAVRGAVAQYLSLAVILEEGLPLSCLDQVMASIRESALLAGVTIVCGDTKIVPSGAADKLFINTTGVGELLKSAPPGASAIQPGDRLIVSGPIGQHGIAVLCEREQLNLSPVPESDCQPLTAVTRQLQDVCGAELRAMRDATRGGVAAVLHEWAEASDATMSIDEAEIPLTPGVQGCCELLGLDPLHIANEGTFVAAVAPSRAQEALQCIRESSIEGATSASIIGTVAPRGVAKVTVRRSLGSEQPLIEPAGAPLPRIC